MNRLTAATIVTFIVMTGCASKPEDIAAVAYPDEAYANLSCQEIGAERIHSRQRLGRYGTAALRKKERSGLGLDRSSFVRTSVVYDGWK